MNSRAQRALRVSCLVYFALVLATEAIARIEGNALPPALEVWRAANPLPEVYSDGGSLAVLGTLIGTCGLLARKGWAVYVHLASTVLWVALGCSTGPLVSAGLSAPLVAAIFVIAGFIYGLAFFTDALETTKE